MNKRPVLLTLLAVIHITGGALALIAIPVLAIIYQYKKVEMPEGLGSFVLLMVVSVFLIAILALVSGIGMMIGEKWGWWIGALYYVYSVVRNVHALITMPGLAEDIGEPAKGLEYHYFKHGARILSHVLLLLYFFRGSVLEYFGLKQQSRIKTVFILIVSALVIWGSLATAQLIFN
ncbi:MAG TPA: hypothetical protein VJC37_02690 [Planctomycetota bacterium]|nr:hypothetical protein [Planctomycetota bacterium]